jgi:hypothetical protein
LPTARICSPCRPSCLTWRSSMPSVATPTATFQYLGATFFDQLIARAARVVIAQVDELVSSEALTERPRSTKIPGFEVDAVVPVERGCHPCGSQGHYLADLDHLQTYARLAADEAGQRKYLDQFVLGCADEAAYQLAITEAPA